MAAVIAALMKLRRSDRLGGRVSLPDRGARPFTYEGTGLMALLSDLGRPKVAPAASPFTSDSRRFSAESQKKGRQSEPKSIWRGCLKDKIKMLRAMTYGDCKIHHLQNPSPHLQSMHLPARTMRRHLAAPIYVGDPSWNARYPADLFHGNPIACEPTEGNSGVAKRYPHSATLLQPHRVGQCSRPMGVTGGRVARARQCSCSRHHSTRLKSSW